MKAFLCWALILTGFVYSACDDDDSDTSIPAADRTFIAKAAEANQSEIELGQLASTKASSTDVQDFGTKMVNEHQDAINELATIASSKGVTMPSALNDTHMALIQRLNKLEGLEFDTAYMNSQVNDHKLVESFFQVEINQGEDADVKAYANKYLPHIQEHRVEAEALVIMLEP